jgi:hypothetical protein
MMITLGVLGLAKLFSRDLQSARRAFARQLRICMRSSLQYGLCDGLAGVAAILSCENQPERAARLLGAARALGYPTPGAQAIDDRLERDYFAPARATCDDRLERDYFAPARATCDAASWRAAQEIGAAMPYEGAIAFALEQVAHSEAPQKAVPSAFEP